MRRGRTFPVLILLAVTLTALPAMAAEDDADASPGYVVVLADGAVLPALTEPVIAFGKVRFMSAERRTVVLRASGVDLPQTRKLNALVPRQGPSGTFSVVGPSSSSHDGRADDREGRRTAGQGGSSSSTATKQRSGGSRSVKVYSATWCPHCQTLKAFLREQNIPFSVIEVDTLPESQQARHRAEMKRLTGRVAFPTVVVGGRARAGFNRQWILDAVGG